MTSSKPPRTARAGVFGLAATIGLVLAVIGSEFLLLHYVYHRADQVRAERIDAAQQLGRAAAGGDASAITAARHQVAILSGRLATMNDQADLIWVVLLLAASVGWMSWFRKLVSRHKALERQITAQEGRAESEARLVALIHNSTDIIAVLDADSTVAFVTPSTRDVLGWDSEEMVGKRWIDDVVHADDLTAFVPLLAGQRQGDIAMTHRAVHRDGRILHLEGTMTNLLGDRTVGGIVLTVRDVTERHALEQQLTHHAFHDALTGLANRRLLADRLQHSITRASRSHDSRPVIVFLDLDDFKNVNDSLGHAGGDKVIVAIAERLTEVVRPADTVARIGGDEFAILMEDSDMVTAEAVARRLLRVVTQPVEVDGVALSVTASVGVAQADDGETWDEALRNADVAMYLAKDRGKAKVAVYEPELHAESLARLEMHADLQRAIREEEFVLHYQPAVELASGRVTGFEALVRWERPGFGLVPPDSFIGEAERCGLIVPLGSWVLRTACRAAVDLAPDDGGALTMAVNVSARQLEREDFVAEVFRVLASTGLAPERLCLEITESALLRDLDRVSERLRSLRERGVRIAVDDFGTGYSSLSYLSKLPVDVLKVDRSFVQRVVLSEQDASVTRAILAMSAALHLETVAEGIEQADQLDWLTGAECAIGQGYFWSRPVPLAEAMAMMQRRGAGVTSGHSGPRFALLTHPQHEHLAAQQAHLAASEETPAAS